MLKVMHIVGARPNFPKIAPIMAEMRKYPAQFSQLLVHTGQHYDYNMSAVFFEELEMPEPDEFLNVGSGAHAVQTANIMTAFNSVLSKHQPDWVFVVGDVNSTLGCALVCSKLNRRIAHVEAGLRTWDRTMPEEINRVLTDQISDLLFTSSREANNNLIREGISPDKIHFVGNVMIDTVGKLLPKALKRNSLTALGVEPGNYVLVTLHRPSNVDDPSTLKEIMTALAHIADTWPIVFPLHPRTRSRIASFNLPRLPDGVRLLEPLGYLDFLALMNSAGLVLTDSGGVQEETTYLGVRCLTARPSTERPVTIDVGTNRLVGSTYESIVTAVRQSMSQPVDNYQRPELWDTFAARRIVKKLIEKDAMDASR